MPALGEEGCMGGPSSFALIASSFFAFGCLWGFLHPFSVPPPLHMLLSSGPFERSSGVLTLVLGPLLQSPILSTLSLSGACGAVDQRSAEGNISLAQGVRERVAPDPPAGPF